MNKVILMGHLGQDAEVRYTPSGSPVASMSLATTEKWNKDGQKHERTEWHRLKLWGDRAERLAEYLVKGKGLVVEGKIRTEQYTDKEGIKRYSTEIVVEQIHFMPGGGSGSRSGSGGERSQQRQGGDSGRGEPLTDDDIPF